MPRSNAFVCAIMIPISMICLWTNANAYTNVIKACVKPTSKVPFTSFEVYVENRNTTVIPPDGWTLTPLGNNFFTLKGGSIAPGKCIEVTLSNPNGGALGRIPMADYDDPDLDQETWVTVCSDPISAKAIKGPATYLGYSIPAGAYGYFYELWNPSDFTDETKEAHIRIGTGSVVWNFSIIPNTFEVDPVPGFDLQDLVVWSSLPWNSDYDFQNYMDAADALGVPGSDMSWEFNSATGVATMKFLPNDPIHGLPGGATGSIVAYLSTQPPCLGDGATNVDVTYINRNTCPPDVIMVPGASATPIRNTTWGAIKARL